MPNYKSRANMRHVTEAGYNMTCISKMTNHTHNQHWSPDAVLFSVALTGTSDHIYPACDSVEVHIRLDLLSTRASSILGNSIFKQSSSIICFSVASIFTYVCFSDNRGDKCKSVC